MEPVVAPPALLAPRAPTAVRQPDRKLEQPELVIEADVLREEGLSGDLVASGHVRLSWQSGKARAEHLTYRRRGGQANLRGEVQLATPDLVANAEEAQVDLIQSRVTMRRYRAVWQDRRQARGERLQISPTEVILSDTHAAACPHTEPDLLVSGRQFRFNPQDERQGLEIQDPGLELWGRPLLRLPGLKVPLTPRDQRRHASLAGPTLGFDPYLGLITSGRVDFSPDPQAHISLPLSYATGRGLQASVEHHTQLANLGVTNLLRYETPWATGQGGPRAANAWNWELGAQGDCSLTVDYRANLNEIAVHRFPEATWRAAAWTLPGQLSLRPTAQTGFLWEEWSQAGAWRTRLEWEGKTPAWAPLGGWQSECRLAPWLNHYAASEASGWFAGWRASWHLQQRVSEGLMLSETLESVRTFGQTPLLHDRLLAAERLRFEMTHQPAPRWRYGIQGAISQVLQAGPWLPEDLGLHVSHQWNCFALSVVWRPLLQGVETRLVSLDF
ncbi:MAG: hypothetical protein VKP62_12085 [Candidatus Sericytochromatia bacterium]|nr:hypothetical protein [Candidatus Sericytochromatia bacterium]